MNYCTLILRKYKTSTLHFWRKFELQALQPFGCQIWVLGMNICFPITICSLWDRDSYHCCCKNILDLGPHHFFCWNDWVTFREPNILFVPHLLYPQLLNFSHRRNFVAKFAVSSYIMESDINSIIKWFDKTAAYQTQSSMVHKKHIWYLHPNPGYIKNHYPLKIISAMFVTIHSVNSKSAA